MTRRPPTPTLFPYTTLFRSGLGKLRVDVPRSPQAFVVDLAAAGQARIAEVGESRIVELHDIDAGLHQRLGLARQKLDRKSTRLNSSHSQISYAVFCLKKKKK